MRRTGGELTIYTNRGILADAHLDTTKPMDVRVVDITTKIFFHAATKKEAGFFTQIMLNINYFEYWKARREWEADNAENPYLLPKYEPERK